MQNFGSLAEEQVNPLRMTGKDEMMFISTIQSALLASAILTCLYRICYDF